MSESFDDLLNRLVEMLEPGQSLLENAYKMLHFLTGDEQVVAHLLDVLGVRIEVCVFDTCMFLDDIKYVLKKRHQTALPSGIKLGGVRVFASVNVRDEMPRKIEELMPQWGIEPQEALRVWETEYAPWIYFVDPSGMPLASDRLTALKQRDSTDLQTGQLIELVHPHAVISKDRDLASFGTRSHCSAIVTCAYRDKGKREVLVLYLSATGILTLRVSAAVLSSLIAWLCKVDKRILLLLVVAGGAAWLYTPSRTWLQERFRAIKPRVQAASQRVRDSLQEVREDYERLKQQADKANAVIAESRRITGRPTTVRDHVSRILSNAAGPLSVAEISRLMQDKGYVPQGAHPEIYLRRVLRAHPSVFGMDEDKRWYIKRHQSA
jgi:hypothetical protein